MDLVVKCRVEWILTWFQALKWCLIHRRRLDFLPEHWVFPFLFWLCSGTFIGFYSCSSIFFISTSSYNFQSLLLRGYWQSSCISFSFSPCKIQLWYPDPPHSQFLSESSSSPFLAMHWQAVGWEQCWNSYTILLFIKKSSWGSALLLLPLSLLERKLLSVAMNYKPQKNQDIPFLDLLHKERALFLAIQSVNHEF